MDTHVLAPARGREDKLATTSCWCGSTRLDELGEGYLECAACGTLARAERPADDVTRVRDEDRDFYGRRYWTERQAELGQGDLAARAVADLPERCLYWLSTALAYKSPPGRALEIGAAHGAFTALLGQAGFDATGLEPSPWVAEEARRAFGVAMLEGPLEDQALEPGSFDLIAAMDVVEHLPDPLGTLTRAAGLLAEDGVLLIQTPCRPAGRSLAELAAEGHRFREMLLPEHLFLFTESSIRELLRRAGLGEAVFEKALFHQYDMFLAAGRRPLARRADEAARAVLARRPAGRLVRAMLDLYDRQREALRELDETRRAYARADDDRTARQGQVERLRRALLEAERQRDDLGDAYRRADDDRTQRLKQVEELREAYRRADDDRTERQRQVDELQAAYREADEDRAERQRRIDEQQEQIDGYRSRIDELQAAYREADEDRAERRRQLDDHQRRLDELQAAYREADEDRAEDRRQLDESRRQLDELRDAYRRAGAELARQRQQAGELRDSLDREKARGDQALDHLGELRSTLRQAEDEQAELRGRNRELQDHLDRELREREEAEGHLRSRLSEVQKAFQRSDAVRRKLRRRLEEHGTVLAALDTRHEYLKSLAIHHRGSRLYRAMVSLGRWRDYDARLLQALEAPLPRPAGESLDVGDVDATWDFAALDTCPERRTGAIAVDLTALLPGGENGGAKLVALALARALPRLAPHRRFELLTSAACHDEIAGLEAENVRRRPVGTGSDGLAEILAGDPHALLFAPMTAPPWRDPRVPLVSLVNDLQFLAYPEFFDDADRADRLKAWRAAAEADRIVTISEHVRQTVLEHVADEERVTTVHLGLVQANGLASGLPRPTDAEVAATLERYGLERDRYFLYPANFWPHKNHRMLLAAFGQYRARRPENGCRLVLTGARRPDPAEIARAAEAMGLGGAVTLAGWVSAAELAALYAGCRGLVFPSLYEGFGLPVLEAMAMGRPVACSATTALPEVAGGAALLFDPRKPAEIAAALERLADDDEMVAELARDGRRRARELGDPERMARALLDLIESALAAPPRFGDRAAGLFGDGWTPGRTIVSSSGAERELELGFSNPRAEPVTVEARAGGERHRATLEPGRSFSVRCRLPAEPGTLEIDVSPTFCPAERGASPDVRRLGLRLWACRLGDRKDLLARSLDD